MLHKYLTLVRNLYVAQYNSSCTDTHSYISRHFRSWPKEPVATHCSCQKSVIYYRPQTRFAKVMFSQVSVCPQGGAGGVCAPMHVGIHPPWAGTPPGRYTPLFSACWDTVNKRAVRIPLECILVLFTIKNLFSIPGSPMSVLTHLRSSYVA